jgi:hypothetical protein
VIRTCPDVTAVTTGEVMSDGNACMGTAAMQIVWQAVQRHRAIDSASASLDGRPSDGSSGVVYKPAAVQGRIGEYKGVWVVSPLCDPVDVWVRPSMKKVDLLPERRTRTQGQFEVCC